MQINKQDEKLFQELLKKYKQGIISGLYPGNNITFTPTGCRDKIISSTGGGASGGVESIVAGDNVTIDDTDPLNPIVSAIGGSSALLPNGVKYLTESRDLQADDAGYILFLLSETEPVVLTIPEISPLQVGDNFEIILAESGDWQNSGFIWSGVLLKPEITESVFFTTTTFEGNPYSLAISTLFTEGKTAFKYLYDQSQNAIPLSGTVSGSPVTGDLVFFDGANTANFTLSFSDGLQIYNDKNTNVFSIDGTNSTSTGIILQSDKDGVLDIGSSNVSSRGIVSANDYSANITDLDYTQKIYVGFRGTATLSSGTVTVATDKVKTGYKIYVSVNTPSGTQGFLSAPTGSIVDATSFVINSTSVLDDSTVNWWIAP